MLKSLFIEKQNFKKLYPLRTTVFSGGGKKVQARKKQKKRKLLKVWFVYYVTLYWDF